jgi:hypothetical protein
MEARLGAAFASPLIHRNTRVWCSLEISLAGILASDRGVPVGVPAAVASWNANHHSYFYILDCYKGRRRSFCAEEHRVIAGSNIISLQIHSSNHDWLLIKSGWLRCTRQIPFWLSQPQSIVSVVHLSAFPKRRVRLTIGTTSSSTPSSILLSDALLAGLLLKPPSVALVLVQSSPVTALAYTSAKNVTAVSTPFGRELLNATTSACVAWAVPVWAIFM